MIDDGDEQLNDDNSDHEEVESAGKIAAKRATATTDRKKRDLIAIGKAKGFLTYDEVNDHMLASTGSADQIDDWMSILGGEGIEMVDSPQPHGADKAGSGEAAHEEEVEPELAQPAAGEEE